MPISGRPPVWGGLRASLDVTTDAAIAAAISSSSSLGGPSCCDRAACLEVAASLQRTVRPIMAVRAVSRNSTRKAMPAPPTVITRASLTSKPKTSFSVQAGEVWSSESRAR